MELKTIGKIYSPYDRDYKNPPTSRGDDDVKSKIEVFKEYEGGLRGLKVGDKIDVIYWADLSDRDRLLAKSKGCGEIRGVFSLRSPTRPNPILISRCEILEINKNILTVNSLETLDQSILLDIKIVMK